VSKHDTHFFNTFSIVLGLLVVFALLIFALAHHMGYKHQFTALQTDPMVLQAIEQRTAIPSRVAVAGQDNTALVIHPVVATAGVVPVMAVPKDGTELYEVACKACHGVGLAGAPKVGDAAAWGPRIAKGKATLYEHAIKGFTGQAGVMPAKGGRTDVSDDLIKEAVDHIIAM
jgi:cytochrome c5